MKDSKLPAPDIEMLELTYINSIPLADFGDWSSMAGFSIDLQAGTIAKRTVSPGTVASVEIIAVGNGWYRCMAHGCNLNNSSTAAILEAFPTVSVNGSSWTTGDGTNGIAMWGMQFEKASFCSSYN